MKKYARTKRVLPKGEEGLLLGYDPNRFSGRSNTQKLNYSTDTNSALGKTVGNTVVAENNNGMDMNQAMNYAKIIGSGANAISGVENGGLDRKAKADAYYDMGKTTASAINPIVGAAWGLGDAIGEPIKNNAERLDNTGTLVDRDKAKMSAGIGSFFNPLKALTTRSSYEGGFTDLTGNKYAASLEKDAQAQYAAEQERLRLEQEAEAKRKYDQQMNYTRAYNLVNPTTGRDGAGIFADGGEMPTTSTSSNATKNNKVVPLDSANYYKALNKYDTINPLQPKEANDVKFFVGNQITPSLKAYQEKLNAALRAKYNLKPEDPITNQFLSKEEADKALEGQYGNYMTYFKAYQDYRGKTPIMPQREVSGTKDLKDEDVYGQRHYNLFAPYAVPSTQVQANGGKLDLPYDMKAPGGNVIPLASDSAKVVGDTHQQDSNNDGRNGITLQANGNPIAEVEHNEVMDGQKVFSEKRGYAKMVEPLLKKKGKLEKLANSTDVREANGGKRMLDKVQADIDSIFEHQQITNPDNKPVINSVPVGKNGLELELPEDPKLAAFKPYGTSMRMEVPEDPKLAPLKSYNNSNGNSSGRYAKTDWESLATKGVPYLDNLYNSSIIAQTPNIPKPIHNVSYDLTPVTLKTKHNVNPQLNDAERAYQMLQKDLNENTSSSVTSRGNKLYAFADLLNNKSKIYGNKENIETDLINKNNMNVQTVTDRNLANRQGVDNSNIALDNTFNWNKMQRTSDINKMKTANYANAVDNMTTQVQDKNLESLDQQRIIMDSLKYGDAAGIAQSIGSPTMDNMVRSNANYYALAEKALIDAGQNAALQEFYKRYGKQN